MGIVQKTPQAEISGYMADSIGGVEVAIVRSAFGAGEKGNNHARQHHTYQDRTGNLTSSMGYNVVKEGQPVLASDFAVVNGGHEGAEAGAGFIKELAGDFPESIALVQVAGMPYAGHVTNKGYDVLDTAEIVAQEAFEKILKDSGLEL